MSAVTIVPRARVGNSTFKVFFYLGTLHFCLARARDNGDNGPQELAASSLGSRGGFEPSAPQQNRPAAARGTGDRFATWALVGAPRWGLRTVATAGDSVIDPQVVQWPQEY